MNDKYFICQCVNCGWKGSSKDCKGGEHNGIDYNDILCPKCESDNIDEENFKYSFFKYVKWFFMKLFFIIPIRKYIDRKLFDAYINRLEKEYKMKIRRSE